MKDKKEYLKRMSPVMQELLKQIRFKLTGSSSDFLNREQYLLLKRKTNIGFRTLHELFGNYKWRSDSIYLSNADSLTNFLTKTQFELYVDEFYSKLFTTTNKLEIQGESVDSELTRRILGSAIIRKVIFELSKSDNLKEEIFRISNSLYSNLQRNINVENGIDMFTYDLSGKEIEFAFAILDFKNTPFSQDHLKKCKLIIKRIEESRQSVFSFYLICNSLTNTEEYREISKDLERLQHDQKVEYVEVFNIRSYVKHVLEHIDIEIRNKILQSNQEFKDDYQRRMNQNFYLADIPYKNYKSDITLSNPIKYLSNERINIKVNHAELDYSINRETLLKDTDTKIKNWTFIISEFGFGKTSLLLNLFDKLNARNILSIFLPLSQFDKKSFYSTNELCRSILKILYTDREFDFESPFDQLMLADFKNMMEKRTDLILLFDGLDEHHYAYQAKDLQQIFRCIKKLRPECFFTMRKEFWDDKQGNFRSALQEVSMDGEILFLSEWSNLEIINYVDQYIVKVNLDDTQKRNINDFKELVYNNNYDRYYGDIPKRPLFLDMVIQDISSDQIKQRNLAEIYELYLVKKFDFDRRAIFGNNQRSPLQLESSEDRDKVLSKIFLVLEKTASLMFYNNEQNECVFLNSIRETQIESYIDLLKWKEFSITEILLNSILVSFSKRNVEGLEVKFSHKSFQEYFIAKYLFRILKENNGDQRDFDMFRFRYSNGIENFLIGLIDKCQDHKPNFIKCLMMISSLYSDSYHKSSIIRILMSKYKSSIIDIKNEK